MLTKKQMIFRVVIFLIFLTLMGFMAVFTLYYANISALNVPHNYRGVFI